MPNKRKVAKKLLVSDIVNATYIKRAGWEPSGVLTSYGEVSRVFIMGVVVSKEENNFLLDDGSGNILVRLFDSSINLENLALGDLVTVVGRPREWESVKYIVPEIIKKSEDKKWYNVHQLTIKLQKKTNPIILPVEPEQNQNAELGPYQKVLNIIAILDKGQGADVQDIINHVKTDNSENIIKSLLEEGEIFEISPGRVKLL